PTMKPLLVWPREVVTNKSSIAILQVTYFIFARPPKFRKITFNVDCRFWGANGRGNYWASVPMRMDHLSGIEKFILFPVVAIQFHKVFQKRREIETRDPSQNFADTK